MPTKINNNAARRSHPKAHQWRIIFILMSLMNPAADIIPTSTPSSSIISFHHNRPESFYLYNVDPASRFRDNPYSPFTTFCSLVSLAENAAPVFGRRAPYGSKARHRLHRGPRFSAPSLPLKKRLHPKVKLFFKRRGRDGLA